MQPRQRKQVATPTAAWYPSAAAVQSTNEVKGAC
jgi:hypothetical protein